MDSARVVHRPAPSITADQARDIRARSWAFVFRCWEEKQRAARPGDPDDAKGSKHDRAEESIHERHDSTSSGI